MSSSFIQIKPIGLPRSWNNPLALTQSPDFPQARRRVSCNLFGKPDRGAINEMYRRDEKQRLEQFQQRYEIIELDMLSASDDLLLSTSKPKFTAITRPTTASASSVVVANNTTTATNIIAESRLLGSSSGGGDGCGESLIEKELREHEMKLKLKQQRKKTVAIGNNKCSNEKLVIAGDRIKSRTTSSKLEEQSAVAAAVTTAVARTFVDSSKCASGHGERPKPYARQQQLQQSSITDYYAQRKTVVCNNSRTASTSEVEEVLPPQVHDESSPIKATIISSSAISHNNESASLSQSSSSSSSSSTIDEQESSSQEQTLHTMTTEVSAKLAAA